MTSEGLHRIERLFEQAARRFSGAELHPVELLRRVQSALEVSVHDGLLGNDITVSFHPADFGRYESAFRPLREEILALVAGIERRERVRRIGDVRTHFEQSQAATPGEPAVAVRFADTSGAVPGLHGPTQRIMRHHGAALSVGGERVPLTHTPFSIGRGVGNDLVIPDLSVSRRHAEIVWSARGFEMVDLGSRNGLRVADVPAERVLLSPGVVVRVGEVDVWLEEEAGSA